MKAIDVLTAIFGTVLKVAVAVIVIVLIYKGALFGYDYGYRVFAEPPLTTGEGRTILFTVTDEMMRYIEQDEEKALSPGALLDAYKLGKQMGAVLENKGLIRDRNLFVLQFLLSEYRVDIKPGQYEISTAMTVDEMLEMMTAGTEEEE